MKITTVKIMKRKNLGNYEHEEVTLEAVLSEGEDAALAIIGLGDLVHAALNGDDVKLGKMAEEVLGKGTVTAQLSKPGEPNATAQMQTGTSYPLAKEENTLESGQAIPPVIKEPARRRRAAAPATEVAAKVETPSANAGGTSLVVGQVDTANVSHVQSEVSTPVASGVVGKGIVAYDSKIKEHRSRFATYLGTTFPNWKPDAKFGAGDSPAKAEYAEKVRVFSGNLHGKAFEDAKGNMLDSFKAELASFFTV